MTASICLTWQKSYELTPREILETADDGSKKNSLNSNDVLDFGGNFEVPNIKATLLCYVTLCYNWLCCIDTIVGVCHNKRKLAAW